MPPSAPTGAQVAESKGLTAAPPAAPKTTEPVVTARAQALADAIPDLQSRIDNAQSGYARKRAKANLAAAKEAINSGDPKEMAVVKKRLDTAARQRKFQAESTAKAPVTEKPTAKSLETTPAPGSSPEQAAMSTDLETEYNKIRAFGKFKFGGMEVDADEVAEQFKHDRAPGMSAKDELQGIAMIIESLKEMTKGKSVEASTKPAKTPKPKIDVMAKVREHYTPGNVIWGSYWGKYDKVLGFKENPDGGWEVTVIDCDKEGNPTPGARPRTHATAPSKGDEIIKKGGQ
jgi:hypothetical protein